MHDFSVSFLLVRHFRTLSLLFFWDCSVERGTFYVFMWSNMESSRKFLFVKDAHVDASEVQHVIIPIIHWFGFFSACLETRFTNWCVFLIGNQVIEQANWEWLLWWVLDKTTPNYIFFIPEPPKLISWWISHSRKSHWLGGIVVVFFKPNYIYLNM